MTDDPRPIRADAGPDGLSLDLDRLARKLAMLPPGAPVVVMIHGWRYAPGFARDCPHGSILSLDPAPQDRRAVSWPRHLGLDGTSGLGIALGWNAKCDPWRAHLRAGRFGLTSNLAGTLAQRPPCRPSKGVSFQDDDASTASTSAALGSGSTAP